MPESIAVLLAAGQARRLRRAIREVRVVVMFHPLQLYLAEALLARHPGAELWYSRWDRYEVARDAPPRMRRRLEALHARAAERAALTFAVSDPLVDLERAEGRSAELVVPPHDFPAPDPEGMVFAVSLGHLGYRTDWGLLRALAERMPWLVLLLVGERHDEEVQDDPDFRACLELPNLVWLGRQPDEAAGRAVAPASRGVGPLPPRPFKHAGPPP